MTVWILTEDTDDTFLGAYSSQEKAMRAVDGGGGAWSDE